MYEIHRSVIKIVEHLERKKRKHNRWIQPHIRCIVDQLPVNELSRKEKIINNEQTTKLIQKKIFDNLPASLSLNALVVENNN